MSVALSSTLQFVIGGALVNLGYRMQDHLHDFDLTQSHELSPDDVWNEVMRQNGLAAEVRELFPRSVEHPVIALLTCMDARIDTAELMGDTRRYYYVVRTAGSALAEAEQEMLELAVIKGVRAIVLTTHSDCAAEKAAKDPKLRLQFPTVAREVDQRKERIAQFRTRPTVRDALAAGKLKIYEAHIDTNTDRLVAHDSVP